MEKELPTIIGHVSLKQTVQSRSHSETSPALSNSNVNRETTQKSNILSNQQQITNAPNGITNYVPYQSPYASRRKEILSRPFSPPINKQSANESDSNIETRSYSPYPQCIESNRCSINGQMSYKTDGNLMESKPHYHRRYAERESSLDRWQDVSRSLSPYTRDYSPWRRENVDPPGVVQPINETGRYSPFVQRRLGQYKPPPQTHPPSHDIYGSPMINRKRMPSDLSSAPISHGSTSPQLLISRFAHQFKQDIPPPPSAASSMTQAPTQSKESAKKRFASYVRLRLGGDRAPSPEPPPRLNRGESPLTLRRNIIDQQPSPSFPRRYVSPSPPQPPPRRLSESNSMPGSPQHVRARLHYTPEPQRRPPLP